MQKRSPGFQVALICLIGISFSPPVFAKDPSFQPLRPSIAQKAAPSAQPAPSSRGSIEQRIYQQLPNFPLENQYVSRESGKVSSRNTLITRLIRYHTQVKGRAPNYRLDWKLTLADYLGANELMDDGVYPGADALKQNPFEGDRAAIRKLTRKQRDALIQVLVNAYTVKP
jgi:hypothetical protein